MSSASPVSYQRAARDAKMSPRMFVSDSQPLPNVPIIHRPGSSSPSALKRAPLDVRKRLLVVDDEAPVLKLVTRILATDNYEVTSASSGDIAAEMVSHWDYPGVDLLVTDLMMPGINGRQLAAIVRKKFPNVRVLYVTGFADTLFKGIAELGAGESFVEKPFGTDGLLEATRLLMFGQISDDDPPEDTRDREHEWTDDRLRARIVRLLRKLRMA
jgi:DNA-binding response OmpR family regulator